MKLAIIGSCNIENLDLSAYIMPDVTEIISGGARGIDEIAEQYADTHRLSKHIIRPLYQKYGKGAPIVRNREIIDRADYVLVFWDGVSRGTKSCLEYLQKYEIPYALHYIREQGCAMPAL